MNAKELCGMLITRSIKDLDEDEEDIVVDYLEKLGIDVDIDTTPKEMCVLLLEKLMVKDLKRRVPITAYANKIVTESKEHKAQKTQQVRRQDVEIRRKQEQKRMEGRSRDLPGCIPSEDPIFSKTLYDLVVDPDLGIVRLSDGSSQYTAVVSVSQNLYEKVFLQTDKPVLELSTSKGFKGYGRIGELHSNADNIIYVTPLIGSLLNVGQKEGAFVKLCVALPEVSKVKYTFYGTQEELDSMLQDIINKLPSVVNGFSYLSLGMVLITDIGGKEIKVRVDGLLDSSDRPIFVGLIPFGESDLPFEISPDM